MISRSRLVERMHAASDAINSQGEQRLLYEQVFVPPSNVICKYVFDQGYMECTMSLVIFSAGPTVEFSRAKANPLVASIRQIFGSRGENRKETLVHDLLIEPAAVTDTEVKRWFTYLLSGLRYSFKPGKRIFRPRSK
jgi:hypothetical protein